MGNDDVFGLSRADASKFGWKFAFTVLRGSVGIGVFLDGICGGGPQVLRSTKVDGERDHWRSLLSILTMLLLLISPVDFLL